MASRKTEGTTRTTYRITFLPFEVHQNLKIDSGDWIGEIGPQPKLVPALKVCSICRNGHAEMEIFSGMEIPEISIGVGNHFRKIGRCVEEIDPKFVVV